MKNITPLILSFVATCNSAGAQNQQLKSYPVDKTDYSALFPANPGKAEVSLSDNELEVFSLEVEFNADRYGLVMVLLQDKFTNSDKETLENLLISYMEFMKLANDITSSIGYIKGQVNASNTNATGIQDFWEDESGAQWAVRGWIDNNVLAVLFIHSTKPESLQVNYTFLDGFNFKKTVAKTELVKVIPKKGKLK